MSSSVDEKNNYIDFNLLVHELSEKDRFNAQTAALVARAVLFFKIKQNNQDQSALLAYIKTVADEEGFVLPDDTIVNDIAKVISKGNSVEEVNKQLTKYISKLLIKNKTTESNILLPTITAQGLIHQFVGEKSLKKLELEN